MILLFPISQSMIEEARGALAVARYRLSRICEELDARDPSNWEVFQAARDRAGEAERRYRGMMCLSR